MLLGLMIRANVCRSSPGPYTYNVSCSNTLGTPPHSLQALDLRVVTVLTDAQSCVVCAMASQSAQHLLLMPQKCICCGILWNSKLVAYALYQPKKTWAQKLRKWCRGKLKSYARDSELSCTDTGSCCSLMLADVHTRRHPTLLIDK